MHVSIPLLVLAAGALSSPIAPEEPNVSIVWETLYTTVDYVTDIVYVTATPAAETPVVLVASSTPEVYQLPDGYNLPADFTKYQRHRHTHKLGSPRPAIQTPAAPTPQQLQVSIQTLTPTSTPELVQSEAESTSTTEPVKSETEIKVTSEPFVPKSAPFTPSVAITPSKTAVANVEVQPPTTFVPDLEPTSHVYKALVLQHHNIHRRNHSAADLTWSDEMAQYAETTAKTCKWGHSLAPGGGGYGQNIAGGIQAGNISAILTNSFYNDELPKYPQFNVENPDMTNFEQWGHFSQLVWNTTTLVGCYTAICSPPGANTLDCKPDGTSYLSGLSCGNGGIPAIFTVCNYHPAGNWGGEYVNVHAPQDKSHVYVNGKGVQGL